MEHILSRVRSMPWKLVRQFLPCTSSVTSLNLRKATSSFCRSARLTSNTRPFRPSEAIPRLQRQCVKCTAVCRDMMHMNIMWMSGDHTTVIIVFHLGHKLLSSRIPTAILQHLLVPWVLVTSVLPRLRMLNMAGALTSYQSFLENGSTLQQKTRMQVKYVWENTLNVTGKCCNEALF